jgi:amino-acid N-acetyltransferase|tara:strand:- start:235 stop:1575 length:1341 start_codon:yes stop_codon:yes gene_type:complete
MNLLAAVAYNPAMKDKNYVKFLRQTSPYIHAHRGKTFVIAISGDAVLQSNFHSMVHDIALLQSLGMRTVVVHGARPQINKRLALSGIETSFEQHLRITGSEAMLCIKEAVGSTRLAIESQLSMGLPNSPMHGARIRVIGGNFVTAKPLGVRDGVDFQRTGEVRRIDSQAIKRQLDDNSIVLISPIGFSATGESFNLNYEDLAAQVAITLKAEKLILVSDSPGVMNKGSLLRTLSLPQLAELLETSKDVQQISLLGAAAHACQLGVERVHLVSYQQDGALLSELLTRDGSGTLISKDYGEIIRAATIEDVGGILELITPLEDQSVLVKRSRELLEAEIARFTVVVHPEGFIVGCAALYPTADKQIGEVACVATHTDFNGQGIGSRLFDQIEFQARLQRRSSLCVMTTQAAHWFLEKGFVRAEVTDLPANKQSMYNYQRNAGVFYKAI